ncbi:DUF4245 family protein [Glycomyces rhizosphaerae]|uniref:DUF4245 family protein n=1 Tax=Glycomyces rhizosphaerae TaxID=2054422 RepID=A0ABV7Q4Z6_9ACTN
MSTEEVKVAGGAVEDGAVEAGAVEDGAAEAADGTADGGAVADAEAVKPARPKQRRMRDMAFSMAVLLVPIGLFYVGWEWLASDRQVSVVDTTENYATAASLGLAAIEPELSDEWKPISTDLAVDGETVTLRTGWYSPDGHGLQVAETNGAVADVDEDLTGAGTPVEAAGIEWAAYESGNGETWVAELDGETIVLSAEPDGTDDLSELAEGVAEATGA